MKSAQPERASECMDEAAMKGYACPDNFKRLGRCEKLAAKKGVTVPQIAMRWIFGQGLNTFAVVSASKPERLQENVAALSLELTREELDYLDLRREALPESDKYAGKCRSSKSVKERDTRYVR